MDNLLNHPLISERYFFPRPDRLEQPFWVECCGVRLGCYFHQIDPDAKTIVHFHGNGEIVGDYLDGFPELLEQFGVNCFLAEFRGYGASSGRPELGRMLEDVRSIIEATGYPQDRLVLFGRSVGSLFAIKALESFPHIAGLILESAIADPLERLLLRITPEEIGVTLDDLVNALEQQLDIRRIIQSYAGPTLIMHTRHDGLVDVAHAKRLASWAGASAEQVVFPHGNHNDIMFVNGPEYFGRVRDFLVAL